MIPFQERKKLRKIVYSKVTLVVLAVLFFVIGEGSWQIHQKAVVAQAERDIEARSLAELQSRTSELEASLARLRSSQGVEEEVRQKYTVARPGEEVVVIVDEDAKKSENGGASTTKSLWQRISSLFGL